MTNLPQDDSPRQLSLFEPIQIPLTKGQVALIDPVDADLAAYKWFAGVFTKGYGAYATRMSHRKMIYLHRAIMERMLGRPLVRGEQVDHIDRNTLNDTRANLRIASATLNRANQRRRRDNRSGYKGVTLHTSGLWRAMIKVAGKSHNVGYFHTPQEAHEAYCAAAQKLFGEYARGE